MLQPLKPSPLKINDGAVKWLSVPLTGIVVFYLSGFAGLQHGAGSLLANYAFFAFISFSVWSSNAYSHYQLRNWLYKIKKLKNRLPARYCVTIVVSWISSFLLLYAWNYLMQGGRIPYLSIFYSQVIMILISIQLSSIYEIVYLNKERQSDLLKMERSEKLKVQAQLDALKSQIDPHFIFNSLNTLSYLIRQNPGNAQLFNDTLARVYRYILVNKEKDLVSLKEEIEFATNYFSLLKIRYQSGLYLHITMNDVGIESYSIPPLSLQTLIENAIKHNHFSEKMRLTIEINLSADGISVLNRRNNKKFDMQSPRIGLANLNERYALIVNKDITISQTADQFSVLLPVVKK